MEILLLADILGAQATVNQMRFTGRVPLSWMMIGFPALLVASGNVTSGMTAATASSSISFSTQDAIAQPTKRIVMTLSTDGPGQSTIQKTNSTPFGIPNPGLKVELTLVAPGTAPTEITVSQRKKPGGTGAVFMGATGTAMQTTVTTSGGTPNQAVVVLRYKTTSAFAKDFELRALVSGAVTGTTSIGRGPGLLSATKGATATELNATPNCVYLASSQQVMQTVQTIPIVPNLSIETTTFLVTRAGQSSVTTLAAAPAWTVTNAQGKAFRVFRAACECYTCTCDKSQGTLGCHVLADCKDVSSSDECSDLNIDQQTDESTEDAYSECQCAKKEDKGGDAPYDPEKNKQATSVDPSDGEKKLDVYDLVIRGRGFDYAFRRVYRSFNYRETMGIEDFGKNWTYSYADEYLLKDNPGTVQDLSNYVLFRVGQNEGAYVNTGPGQWESPLGRFSVLRRNPFTGDFELRQPDGMVRVYHNFLDDQVPNNNGRLKALIDPNDNVLTCHYEDIDPDDTIFGDEKRVLAFVIDTLGREIRYQYYAKTAQTVNGRQVTIVSANSAAWGRLARVEDFKGNMDFDANEEPDFPGQFANRELFFDYDDEGNLVQCSRPKVGGTPNGNDFANGRTVRYQYIKLADLPTLVPNWSGLTTAQQDLVEQYLLHKITHVWYPNEVRENAGATPPDSEAAEVLTYDTSPVFDPPTSNILEQGTFLGFVTSYTVGGTNGNGVPSGGTIRYTYTDLNPDKDMPINVWKDATILYEVKNLEVDVVDRKGNDANYIYGGGKTLLEYRELTLDNFRALEPEEYLSQFEYNPDRLMVKNTKPEGNMNTPKYNSPSLDRFQQGNLIGTKTTPDGVRGGDQSKIEGRIVHEPAYQKPCLLVQARGTDIDDNDFTPPIPDPAASVRQVPDPYFEGQRIDARYFLVKHFDYQESTEKAANAPNSRLDKDGSGGQVNQSPLIEVDPNVLTTEVWLVQELGLPETAAGLTEFRNRLSANLARLGLGDLNGDGDTTPAIAGNVVRMAYGSPVILANVNQHALETDIESAGDLVDETKTFGDGGTQEGSFGDRLQTIVWMYQYNQFGQLTKTISPEGNVTTYTYFPENDPDGDGIVTPAPADGRVLDTVTGGYLEETLRDTTRSYVQQTTGTLLTGTFSNNDTNPAVTDIRNKYTYDDVGNAVTMTNGRGIRDDYFVNESDEVVQTTRAADISGASSADPPDPLVGASIGPLTAFAYKSRTFFDYNGNGVLSQREDRGNTSSVDGSGLGTLPLQATDTTPGLSNADAFGGDAYVDSLSLYDRIDNAIEMRVEVDNTRSLDTRYRYDRNQHQVLAIYPAGNANSWVYDERELLFQETRGASTRPTAGLYASGDPTTFDRPGGAGTAPSRFTYNYDKNQNLVETVDAEDTDGSAVNSSVIAGNGDVAAYTYDGFDRRQTARDPDGNPTRYVYDPDSNVVRVIQDGDPIDDVVPGAFPDGDNKTLAVTETIHDELSRVVVTHRVLFRTPDATPTRTPTLTDTPAMDVLAAYLSDASSDTAAVPGAVGITVIGRVTTLTEYDRESRATFTMQDDLDARRTDYDGARRSVRKVDSALSNGFSAGAFNPSALFGNVVEMAYDDDSNDIEQKETDVTTIVNVAPEVFRTTSLYDALDRLQSVVDNLGQTQDLRYDSRSNAVAMADAVGPVTSRTVSRRGLGSTAGVAINDFGNVTRSTYDGIGRVLETEARLTSSGQGDGTKIGASLEGVKTTAPTVDAAQSGDGLISVYQAWDANSQLLALRDDDGNTTAYVFDNQNRTLVERKGLDVTGTSFTVSGGDSGAFNVALRGGVAPVDTETNGTDITYTFDRDSNVTSTEDEAANTIARTFDALNRRITCSITRATGFIGTTGQTWKYDGLSRMTECFDNNEPTSTTDDVACQYFYDSLSRKVEETQKIGDLGAKAVSCGYEIDCGCGGNAIVLPSECIYPDGRKVHSGYDRLDRLVSRNDDDGLATYSEIGRYEYIGTWRVATLTYQNDTRLTHIGQVSGQNADVGFDDLRRVVNHRWESFTTEPLGNGTLIEGFEHQDGTASPVPLYDRTNNKRIEYKTHDPSNSEQYKYDSAYRLTSTGSGSQGVDARSFERGTFTNTSRTSMAGSVAFFQDWDLEGLGNWTRLDDDARVETRDHSDFNEIFGRTVVGNTSGLAHDKNGNMGDTGNTTLGGESFPGGGFRLEFDALNRMWRVYQNNNTLGTTSDDAVVGEYTYDCMNRRMRKVVTNSGALNGMTDYYYEGWRVYEERDGSDSVTQQYMYGNYLDEVWTLDDRRGGITVAQLNDSSGTERHFYQCNPLYAVYGLTDEIGTLKEAYQYDAYGGQTVITDGNDPDTVVNFTSNDVRTVGGASTINGSPYMYTGQRLDPESSLLYCKNRYYTVNLGRFLSRDVLGYRDDINGYAYVRGSATKRTDPYGLQAKPGWEKGEHRQNLEKWCKEKAGKACEFDDGATSVKGSHEMWTKDVAPSWLVSGGVWMWTTEWEQDFLNRGGCGEDVKGSIGMEGTESEESTLTLEGIGVTFTLQTTRGTTVEVNAEGKECKKTVLIGVQKVLTLNWISLGETVETTVKNKMYLKDYGKIVCRCPCDCGECKKKQEKK